MITNMSLGSSCGNLLSPVISAITAPQTKTIISFTLHMLPQTALSSTTLADSANKLTKAVLQSQTIPANTRQYRPTHLE